MQSDIGHPFCDQLTAVKTGYPLTSIAWPYRGLRYRPVEVEYFLEVIRWQVTCFQMIAGSSSKSLNAQEISCVYEPRLSRTNKSLISNWPRTRKFSKEGNYFWLTMVTLWSRSTSNFYVLIGQNLTGEFMRKIYAASWKLFTLTAEADRVLCQLVMFLTVFLRWMYKMKFCCYQESSVIHSWFVYWVFGWEMLRLSKSLEIRFRMASFLFFILLDA